MAKSKMSKNKLSTLVDKVCPEIMKASSRIGAMAKMLTAIETVAKNANASNYKASMTKIVSMIAEMKYNN